MPTQMPAASAARALVWGHVGGLYDAVHLGRHHHGGERLCGARGLHGLHELAARDRQRGKLRRLGAPRGGRDHDGPHDARRNHDAAHHAGGLLLLAVGACDGQGLRFLRLAGIPGRSGWDGGNLAEVFSGHGVSRLVPRGLNGVRTRCRQHGPVAGQHVC